MTLLKISKFMGMLGVLLMALLPGQNLVWGQTPPGTCSDVSEASSYTLVYELNIPVNADYNNTLPPYSINESATITAGSFDRVAYCLQLNTDYVWVSMDTFTPDPVQVGVPVIAMGNIEFWHGCYFTTTMLGLPGASSRVCDFDVDHLETPAMVPCRCITTEWVRICHRPCLPIIAGTPAASTNSASGTVLFAIQIGPSDTMLAVSQRRS